MQMILALVAVYATLVLMGRAAIAEIELPELTDLTHGEAIAAQTLPHSAVETQTRVSVGRHVRELGGFEQLHD